MAIFTYYYYTGNHCDVSASTNVNEMQLTITTAVNQHIDGPQSATPEACRSLDSTSLEHNYGYQK